MSIKPSPSVSWRCGEERHHGVSTGADLVGGGPGATSVSTAGNAVNDSGHCTGCIASRLEISDMSGGKGLPQRVEQLRGGERLREEVVDESQREVGHQPEQARIQHEHQRHHQQLPAAGPLPQALGQRHPLPEQLVPLVHDHNCDVQVALERVHRAVGVDRGPHGREAQGPAQIAHGSQARQVAGEEQQPEGGPRQE
eukprot:CAMPEP_0174310678 /NCGR_PEP_ID=MMETSP0810-20121108/3201_1 /TAXON_ID=73025 ORGANISM="Eutreptiella gymnastica-like, Strain CCMP1594" /NCGR_SAMPLE_ID=MMETSP0810 /ASSEMBLY_ACC=CAM_ASM_000659 /LENGTH=196 /DNA_ID=CAMNT_0015418653 /DNA_START=2097 /DNA_END=2685 /DNA_ORIENTATION=+